MHAESLPEPAPSFGADLSAHPEDAIRIQGHAHFLTISTLFRRPLFLDPEGARAVARMQSSASLWGRSRCLAWVLMPDRWQGLVDVAGADSIECLVRRFKAMSCRCVDARFRVNGWLWSKGFNERQLVDQGSLRAVARHLVANPVRSGLAKSVGDYPYWNSAWLK